nr:YWFCY domain-containing protein [uncultured Dysgonomonas sp.]
MQNEDDLRGPAKVMEFIRAISILFVLMNIYWFCYPLHNLHFYLEELINHSDVCFIPLS